MEPAGKPIDPIGVEQQLVGLIAPVNVRNGMAIASGYLGLLALFCAGPILGIPAMITGYLALKKPELGGKGRAWIGIVLGAIATFGYPLAYGIGSMAR